MLDILSSLSSSLSLSGGDVPAILTCLQVHLRQLLPLQTIAFLLANPDTGEFEIADCEPSDQRRAVQQAVDAAVDQGTFAWALQQNRPVFTHPPESPDSSMVLHSVATRNRCLGMFVGLIGKSRIHEYDASIRLVSILLSQGSFALENAMLQSRIMGQNAELEKKVNERTTQLEVALVEAQQSALVKARFLANMSHEIRTPLNGILGIAELLEDSPLDDEQMADVRTLRECGRNLLVILSDILDLAKIEAGKLMLESEPIDIALVATDTINLLSPLAQRKGISLEVVVDDMLPPTLLGDTTRLKQVLLNLVGNAIKFTERGKVTLDVHLACPEALGTAAPLQVRFDIIDTGIGMAESTIEKLFHPFTQADSSTTRIYGGTGLGLAICKSLCDLMNGSIWVKSELGKGSVFSCEIPFDMPEVGNATRHRVRPVIDANLADIHPLRILVVDDSAMHQLVTSRMLTKMGYAPRVAINGAQALDIAHSSAFDIIFIDLQMPDLTGYEVLEELRKHPGPGLPPRLVAMTASTMLEDREHCKKAGFDGFLAKPFSIQDIKQHLLETPPQAHISAA
jgi:signal transduction histidine kinase/ActR/RegA family two-component response regulator